MAPRLYRGARVVVLDRAGVVLQILHTSPRGFPGGDTVDVMVRFDDGVAEWCDPDEIRDESLDPDSGIKC